MKTKDSMLSELALAGLATKEKIKSLLSDDEILIESDRDFFGTTADETEYYLKKGDALKKYGTLKGHLCIATEAASSLNYRWI